LNQENPQEQVVKIEPNKLIETADEKSSLKEIKIDIDK